ncbi:MAG: PD40 domain-containing protein [Deltaproteobacteria bacterium]|nr:PD40 domain-containing protein [Deltaproteobacteria bacterium]
MKRAACPLTAALVAALALLAPALPARGHDPRHVWSTLETPHFSLHYHEGLGELAQRAARALEGAHERLVPLMGHAPERRVEVVLSDETDSANGSATAWIRPVVNLLAVPPDSRSELNDYEDYLWNLVVHEYTHVLHLDTIDGVPWLVNQVFGQLWIPNGIQPRWFIEGLAVYQESAHSGSGRNRSSLYDMYLRAQVLEGGLYGLDDASGYPTTWPRGGLAYLHGSRFLQWVADTRGPEVFAKLSQDYGSQIIPYAINATAKDHLGETWISLYEEWEAELTGTLEGQIAAIRLSGASAPQRLTFRGEGTGEPRFLSADQLLYLEDSADRRSALRRVRVDGSEDEQLREVYGGGTLAVAPDRRHAFLSQLVPHDQHYLFEDLFRVDLESGELRQLTFGKRLTEPDVSPDGKALVAVRRVGSGRTAIVSLPAAGGEGEPRILYEAPSASTVFTPRFSPDGRRVAFSEQRSTGRDIRLLDLESGQLEDLTRDRALDLDPVFDPGGKRLYFVSDRTGVFNVYALELESGQLFQVTHMLTGAFRPAIAPDGRRLAFVTYSRIGYDVSTMSLDPAAFRPAPAKDLRRPAPPAWETRELYPSRPYQPWRTLRPYYWLPIMGADPQGPTLGVTTSGADVVGRHSWALQAALGLSSGQPAVEASYSTQVWYPYLDLDAGTHLGSVPNGPDGLLERQYHGSAALTFPFSSLDQRYQVSVGYGLRYYAPWDIELPRDPTEELPFQVERGLSAALSLGLGFSNAQGFANGISAERGLSMSVNLRGARPEWGSQFRYWAAEASLTKYLAMPWLEHHALALRLSGGISDGDLGGRRVFGLGGLSLHDPLLDLLQLNGVYGAGLRGYRPGEFSGSKYTLLNAEYRFPLVRVDAGLWSLPFYLRRIHGALTCDVGEAADVWTWRGLKPSVGAELRAELYLGYALSTTLRLGYARGLASEGVNDFFFGLGSSF